MNKPELLAPGGSFLAAYYAFQAGADGVYLGMKEFSARRGAANFTLESLRRILSVARERGGKVYLALNTVVREQELERAAEILFWAESLGLDGVIVQDLGIAELARSRFPALPLHASTQMAVHDSAGLRLAAELGFRRVILSRELDFQSIRRLRAEHPGIELEVFIHGALCYSFSGLCLASWALTGRSGNRGDCAQICRSLFRSAGGAGYLFSCRDLALGPEVRRLMEIGIDAFKIEGRMKSPEYVYHTVRLYRAVIDRGPELGSEELAELERRAALGFARRRTRAYFADPKGERLLDAEFPGHRGAPLGAVEAVRGGAAEIRLEADLSLRDGLMYFPSSGARDPVVFSVRRMTKDGRAAPFARRGERVAVQLPEAGSAPRPAAGQTVYQLSSRFLDLPQPKEGGFPLYRIPCRAEITLTGPLGQVAEKDSSQEAVLEAEVFYRQFPQPFRWRTRLPLQRAAAGKPFAPIVTALFREAGECPLEVGEISFVNRTGWGEDSIFVPPSRLKQAKNAFYQALREAFEQERLRRLAEAAADRKPPLKPADRPRRTQGLLTEAAHRERLAPLTERREDPPHPFVDLQAPPDPNALADVEGWRFLPLPPISLGRQQVDGQGLRELLSRHPEQGFAVGLSNVAHLVLAREFGELPNVSFFVDFYLYAANRFAVDFLSRWVPKLLFVYHWLEASEEDYRLLADVLPDEVPLVRLAAEFRPPLFYGIGCPRRQGSLPGSGPPGSGCRDCPGGFTLPLSQGKNRFVLRVRDCTAYLYRLP